MNNDWLDLAMMNPKARRALHSFSNQALGACFNPYKDLCNLHTKWGCLGSTNPGVCSMNTFSYKSPFKNVLLISNCLKTQFLAKAIVNATLHPIAFLSFGRDIKDHVLFLISAKNSSVISAFHCSCCKASVT